ncbi:MAG: hypothetical protein LBK73_00940, partial [Treponema sp.]|nr:hypothetical protein [Treponema sp.]
MLWQKIGLYNHSDYSTLSVFAIRALRLWRGFFFASSAIFPYIAGIPAKSARLAPPPPNRIKNYLKRRRRGWRVGNKIF